MISDSPLFFVGVALRWTGYLCVFLLVGLAVFRRVGLPAALEAVGAVGGETGLQWAADTRRKLALRGMVAGFALVAVDLARAWDQTYAFFGSDESITLDLMKIIVNGTLWGSGWKVQTISAGCAGVAFAMLLRRWPGASFLLYPSVLVAAISRPLTGHALEQGSFFSLPAILQAVHVLSAAVWIGTLLVTVTVGVWSASQLGAARGAAVAAMVNAFSPLAMGAVTALFMAGTATSFIYLGGVGPLFGTTYGLVLLAKFLVFAAVGGIGLFNWRRVRPQLELVAAGEERPASGTEALLLRSAGAELALAVVVLALTAVLVALPMPMG